MIFIYRLSENGRAFCNFCKKKYGREGVTDIYRITHSPSHSTSTGSINTCRFCLSQLKNKIYEVLE